MLDLVKAFKKVGHPHLAHEALVYNFPLALLRVIVSQFAGERRIVYDCIYSEAVVTDFAIIAGSRFGPGLLRLSITSPLDKWAATWPFVSLRLYVDDLSPHNLGTTAFIAQHAYNATVHLVKLLEEHSGAEVSRGRFGVIGGSLWSLRGISP